MSKRITFMFLILFILLSCSSFAANFSINYLAGSPGWKFSLSGFDNDSDNYDNDLQMYPEYMASMLNIGIYHVNGVNWDGDTGFYVTDRRSEIIAGSSKVFDNIHIWAGGNLAPTKNIVINLNQSTLPNSLNYALYLDSCPEGIAYSGKRVWSIKDSQVVLPYYSSIDGLSGYKFHAIVSTVPEPTGTCVLFLGLTGLCCRKLRIFV